MNLEKLNLVELSVSEAKNIEGGSWIGRVWKWIKDHISGGVEIQYDSENGLSGGGRATITF